MSALGAVYRREVASYFATPIAYVFIVIFLALSGAFTFWLGGFYERGQADLAPFFGFHPWLYLFLVPAIAMRLWAEERRSGSIELLLTLPIRPGAAVLAKFLAAWTFIAAALALTFPIWITINYLGSPDNGAIFAAYLGSLAMAGSFLAIGSCLSAATRSQVIAFILTAVVCFLLLLAGYPLVLDGFRDWAPPAIVDAIASLSFLKHFEAISKGVLDLRDVLYFAMTIGTWLYATTLVLEPRRAKWRMTIFPRQSLRAATFVTLAVLFVAATALIDHGLRGARLDLTQNRLYTLAPGTRRLVSGLAEPVSLYFFFSQQSSVAAPPLRSYANRVRDLLEELAAHSDGRIRLHVLDPEPYSDEEDRATELGLHAVPLGRGGEDVWFGLAGTNSTDGRAVIDFFDPQKEAFLEYDVARLIHQLAAPRRKVVGLLTTLPMLGEQDAATGEARPPWTIAVEMQELFDLRVIAPDATALPAGLDALFIIQPKGLAPALGYAIDQWLLAGGRLLLCVDPDAQQDHSREMGGAYGGDRSSTFEPMLAAWGVRYDPRFAFGDLERALLVGDAAGQAVRHLAFAGFGPDNLASGDVITSSLGTINLGTPGFLQLQSSAAVQVEALITSGRMAAPIPIEKLATTPTPDSLRRGFSPTGARYIAAARVRGLLPSAYPAGPPAGVTTTSVHLSAATAPAEVVIVADTDFLGDALWVRPATAPGQSDVEPWASNGDFVLNALDNLTGSADLIGIRGRATYSRPFTRVDRMRALADERLRGKAAELEQQLASAEHKLATLQGGRDDHGPVALSAEQQRAVLRFQQDKLRIRKELRGVRRGLDQEINRLGVWLKAVNVVAMPALLSVGALGALALQRRRRRARATAAE